MIGTFFCSVPCPAWPPARAKRAFTIEDYYRCAASTRFDGSGRQRGICGADERSAQSQAGHPSLDDGRAAAANRANSPSARRANRRPRFRRDGKWIAFVSSRDGIRICTCCPWAAAKRAKSPTSPPASAIRCGRPTASGSRFRAMSIPECGADDACNKKIAERWSKGKLQAHMADGLLYRHWTEWKDGKRTHIFLAEVATRQDPRPDAGQLRFAAVSTRRRRCSTTSRPTARSWSSCPITTRKPASSTNNDLWIVLACRQGASRATSRRRTRLLTAIPNTRPTAATSPTACRSSRATRAISSGWRFTTGRPATSRVLTESFRNWIDDFDWSPDSKSIYFSGAGRRERADLPGRHRVRAISTRFCATRRSAISRSRATDAASSTRAVRSASRSRSIRADLRDGAAAAPRRLSHFNDAVAERGGHPAGGIDVGRRRGRREDPDLHRQAARFRSVEEVSADPERAWRTAEPVGRRVPRRLAGLSRRRLRRGVRQSARLHRATGRNSPRRSPATGAARSSRI